MAAGNPSTRSASCQRIADGRAGEVAADYRRQARRLRARLAGRPAQLYRTLRALADQADRAAAADARRHPGPASRFAGRVERSLDGPVLRYSKRTELIDAAMRDGIDRFEANLIIAAVLHRRDSAGTPCASPQHRTLPLVLTFIVVQSAVIVAGVIFWARLLGGPGG